MHSTAKKIEGESQVETEIPPAIQQALTERLGEKVSDFLIPPPVFTSLEGKFLTFDRAAASLSASFPVLEKFLNPYRMLQGGILAALVDNTIGPLSVLVAPPNVTRRLSMKYSAPVTMELAYVIVEAQLTSRDRSMLKFKAWVKDPQGNQLASAEASHWILESEGKYA
jgi:acyl-coenzyme A thioesterase PaaI-like protein